MDVWRIDLSKQMVPMVHNPHWDALGEVGWDTFSRQPSGESLFMTLAAFESLGGKLVSQID